MKNKVLAGYIKSKKRDLFWRGFHQANSLGKETLHMLPHAERLLAKKDRAVQMLNRLFE